MHMSKRGVALSRKSVVLLASMRDDASIREAAVQTLIHGQRAEGRGDGIPRVHHPGATASPRSGTSTEGFGRGARSGPREISRPGSLRSRATHRTWSRSSTLSAGGPGLSEETGVGAEYTAEGFFHDGVLPITGGAERQRMNVPPCTETGELLPAGVSHPPGSGSNAWLPRHSPICGCPLDYSKGKSGVTITRSSSGTSRHTTGRNGCKH